MFFASAGKIGYEKWAVDGDCRQALLLVHGLGAHSSRWKFLADFFVSRGVACYALELQGFGQTENLAGHIDSFQHYYHDITSLEQIIHADYPQAKIFVLGESMGGLIVFLLSLFNPGLFSGCILISPAFRSVLKFSLFEYIKMFAAALFNPKTQFKMPFTSAMCTRDLSYQAIMNQDVREHRLASARLLINILLGQFRADFLKAKFSLPILFLLAQRDYLVDPKKSHAVFKGLTVKDKALIDYPQMYHALSIDLGREKVFSDIYQWLEKR